MARGRTPKPTAVHAASGQLDARPGRFEDRGDEPKPAGPLGDPPEAFLRDTPETRKLLDAWHELEKDIAPGVLKNCDRWHMEAACRLMVRCRRPDAKPSDFTALNRFLAQMGMNPADRTRIRVEKEKEADRSNGWRDLADERRPTAPVFN